MPSAELPTRESSALGFVRSALLERLPLKAVAVFFAFVLWLAVSADEPGEQTLPVRLALRVDSSLALRGARPSVSATLTGRRRDLLKVRAGDLVLRRAVGATSADSVRLVLRPGDVELPPSSGGEVSVRDVQPRQLTLHFVRAAPRDTMPPVAARPTPRVRPAASARPPGPVADEPLDPEPIAGDSPADTLWADTLWADTLWEVPQAPPAPAGSMPGAAPNGEAASDSAAAREDSTAARDVAADSAPGGPPPNIIIPRADSATITRTAPAGAPRRTPPGEVPFAPPASRPPQLAP